MSCGSGCFSTGLCLTLVVVALALESPWPDLAMRAELAVETGDAELALSRSGAALAQFEAVIASLGRDPDRLALCDDVQVTTLYVTAARAAILLAEQRERAGDLDASEAALAHSFELSDRGHSLALATLVAGAAQAAPHDDALQRRWQQAATDWSAAFERLLAAYDAERDDANAAPATDLTNADAELVRLEAEIETRRPGTLAAARRLPPRIPMSAVQEALTPDACLLQYHVVGQELLLWGQTRTRACARRVRPDTGGVEPLVEDFWRTCSTGARGSEGDELVELLLAPLTDVLAGAGRVVVVGFGPLAGVPFHALPFEGAPLGRERVISYLPAASMLAGRGLDQAIRTPNALAVGDPAFDPELHPSLRRLPGAAVEAGAVSEYWAQAEVLVDVDASESHVRKLLPASTVVHLAAHGYLDEIAPSNSSIVLAGADTLTVSDLIGLRFGAELAILSACDSGRGSITLGGDVIGLTRGLLAAGVDLAIVSLWPVDDVAACVTMDILHQRLASGSPPAHALFQAQAGVRDMSADQIAARYIELGGRTVAGSRSMRRGSGAPIATGRRLALDPEFIDTDSSETEAPDQVDGRMERVWAPFILVGV